MMLIDGNDNDGNDNDYDDYDGSNDNDVNGQDATVVERSREHGQAFGNQEWAATGKVEFYDGRDFMMAWMMMMIIIIQVIIKSRSS